MTLLSLTGLTLSPSASFPQSCNMCKVPFKFAGSLYNNQIPTVPGKRYSIPCSHRPEIKAGALGS